MVVTTGASKFSAFQKLSEVSPISPTQPPLPRPQGASDFISVALFRIDCQLTLGLGLTLPFVVSGLAGPLLQLRPGQFQFRPILICSQTRVFFYK